MPCRQTSRAETARQEETALPLRPAVRRLLRQVRSEGAQRETGHVHGAMRRAACIDSRLDCRLCVRVPCVHGAWTIVLM